MSKMMSSGIITTRLHNSNLSCSKHTLYPLSRKHSNATLRRLNKHLVGSILITAFAYKSNFMIWYLVAIVAILAAWLTYEIHRAPNMEDENTTFKNHDGWDDYHPDQPI
jgi:hypothetical protein